MPFFILLSENNSEELSVLITRGYSNSDCSDVLNRISQDIHSLRLLIAFVSLLSLESITLVSGSPQKGQRIT
jgi:hypothetical protein